MPGSRNPGMKIIWVVALSAVSLFADVSGKWSGSFDVTVDGETKADTALLNLKQAGDKITGTAGPNEEKQMRIRAGSIDGNTITLEVEPDENDHPVIYLTLVVDGDHMTGSAKAGNEEHKMTAKVDLKRQQ
jgi:hypothetical protein